MAGSATESSPLLPSTDRKSSSGSSTTPRRTVTFSPHLTTSDDPGDSAAAERPSENSTPAVSSAGADLLNASFSTGHRRSSSTTSALPTPLLPQHHVQPASPLRVGALNGKLKRRSSHGAPLLPSAPASATTPKIGPLRTTKNTQKLKLLPNPDPGDGDEESGRDVYSQFTRIKDPNARRDAARLGKEDREKLPRVTAYCTASSYRMDALMKFLKSRIKTRGTAPKQFDECIYSPFSYGRSKSERSAADGHTSPMSERYENRRRNGPASPQIRRRRSDSALEIDTHLQSRREDLIDLDLPNNTTAESPAEDALLLQHEGDIVSASAAEIATPPPENPDFDTTVHTPEVFLFEYGTVVIWGMTLAQEQRFLKDLVKFEVEKLAEDDVQTEDFNFYYTREYQARIYNDFISLREKRNYMTKLAISHALAQSVKTSLFEDLLATTIAATTPLPALLASQGSISLSRKAINQKIGELFILRINIHLQGSVLDSPELMWAEPQLQPVYDAVRAYLEMDQRVSLLTERLDVLNDLLAVLKDQVRTSHGEALEWIVIILIAAEILVAAVNIVVDLYAGVE